MDQNPQWDFKTAGHLADVYAKHIDQPQATQYSNPTYSRDPGFPQFSRMLEMVLGGPFTGPDAYNPQQFGETQNPPQYRGIRMLLPQTGGENYASLQQGRVPNFDALQQMLLGTMISRGYPVYGGNGPMPGFEPGFNPVGFGQR